jgi:hypothetical protein
VTDDTRTPITNADELAALDPGEVMAGYRNGYAGDTEPGGNYSKAFWHGWRNGMADRTKNPDDAQRALARDYIAKGSPR